MNKYKIMIADPSKSTGPNHKHFEQFIHESSDSKDKVLEFFKLTDEYKEILKQYDNEDDIEVFVTDM